MTEASGAATYLAYLHEQGREPQQGQQPESRPVDWTESPAHLSALLRHEIQREKELVRVLSLFRVSVCVGRSWLRLNWTETCSSDPSHSTPPPHPYTQKAAADAARHRNARAQLRAVQQTYAQGLNDVARCARSRRYVAETNRALQTAVGRTLEGLQGFVAAAGGEGKREGKGRR